jgi:hypothetical protein
LNHEGTKTRTEEPTDLFPHWLGFVTSCLRGKQRSIKCGELNLSRLELTVMPLWLQTFVVVSAVLACLAFIAWQAVLSLQGHKSKLNGCGSCKSCGANETPTPTPKASTGRVAIIPLEMLARRRK